MHRQTQAVDGHQEDVETRVAVSFLCYAGVADVGTFGKTCMNQGSFCINSERNWLLVESLSFSRLKMNDSVFDVRDDSTEV